MMDTDERQALLERALYEGFARLYDSEVITTPTWGQIITPTLDSHMRNSVCRSILTEAEVDARLSETIRLYQSKGLRCSWVVGPRARPRDLGERLLAAGFRLNAIDIGMTAELSRLPPLKESQRAGPRLTLELLGEHNVDTWLSIHDAIWSIPPEAAARMREVRQRWGFKTDHGVHEYVIRVEERAVGIIGFHRLDGFVHLSTGAVVPEFQKQGIFRRAIHEQLGIIRELGCSFVTAHAIRDTAAPILQKLGFQWEGEFNHYVL
jgi:GNAT superfamily N-acetyltransferase